MYNQKDNTENIIFTEKTKMAIDNSKLSSHEFHRNKNAIVIGCELLPVKQTGK